MGLALEASNGPLKTQKTIMLYLRYALTNQKSETTFANRHGGLPRVKVASEWLKRQA